MFEWLTGIIGSIVGIPMLIILVVLGYTLPKWVSWTLFILIALFWAGFLPGLESAFDTIRGLIGIGGATTV